MFMFICKFIVFIFTLTYRLVYLLAYTHELISLVIFSCILLHICIYPSIAIYLFSIHYTDFPTLTLAPGRKAPDIVRTLDI